MPSVFIHNQNLRTSATEMFKITKDLVPDTFPRVFDIRYEPNYNLKSIWIGLINSFSAIVQLLYSLKTSEHQGSRTLVKNGLRKGFHYIEKISIFLKCSCCALA